MIEPLTTKTKKETCERCGAAFECKADDIKACHCSSITLTASEQKYIALKFSNCLCNNCLSSVKEEYEKMPAYYFENGLLVMTEKYHLERGFCCKNNCRHCPYKYKAK
ncbi:MAG: cysteine-rich CWC family protein [Chitinophagales bacterium]|nr:cysteine-rich CWC family protein [Chitinophagales bacterium]